MKFVRFGSLNKTDYGKGTKVGDFHTSPVRKGIYAFPFAQVENFLVAWKFSGKNYKAEYQKARKEFEFNGYVWHHFTYLSVSKHIVGSWALDDIHTYKKILAKVIGRAKAFRARNGYGYSKDAYEVFIAEKI